MQYYSSQNIAYFQAQAELKRKVSDDIRMINNEINHIIKQKPVYNLADESTDSSSDDEQMAMPTCIEIPLTQPIQSIQQEAEEESEVDEEQLVEEMRDLLQQMNNKPKNGKSVDAKKKIKILQPLQEEGFEKTVSRDAYKAVFKRCHQDLKDMRIGKQSKGNFFKSAEKLTCIIEQLNHMRNSQWVPQQLYLTNSL